MPDNHQEDKLRQEILGDAKLNAERIVARAKNEAQKTIDAEMARLAERDILRHADVAEVNHISTENEDVRYKLLLLPMYLSSFKYKDSVYQVLVNGQTGKTNGQSPVSPWRVLVAVLIGSGLMGIGGILLGVPLAAFTYRLIGEKLHRREAEMAKTGTV